MKLTKPAFLDKYGGLLAVLGSLIVIALFIGGAYHEFTTKEIHARDHQMVMEEIAGVSVNQKIVGSENYIRYLEKEIREIRKKYGSNVNSYPPDVAADYLELVEKLKAERQRLNNLRTKLK